MWLSPMFKIGLAGSPFYGVLIGVGFCVCPFWQLLELAVAIWHSKGRPILAQEQERDHNRRSTRDAER